MVKTVFDLYRGKQKFGFSSVFAFKQAKEQILFQVQPLQILNTKLLFAQSFKQTKFSVALRQVKMQQ